ncbi:MAG: hypothetical protein ACK5FE_10105 [Cyanobacteriota bacterium]|jgi:hypothetical protein
MKYDDESKISLLKQIADLERLNTQIEQDAFERTNSCAKALEEMTAKFTELSGLYEQTLSELELAHAQIRVIHETYQEKLNKLKAATNMAREAIFLD